ncbi:hypothetical protein KXV85_001327, partial [Aspergillus fumigatus]
MRCEFDGRPGNPIVAERRRDLLVRPRGVPKQCSALRETTSAAPHGSRRSRGQRQ